MHSVENFGRHDSLIAWVSLSFTDIAFAGRYPFWTVPFGHEFALFDFTIISRAGFQLPLLVLTRPRLSIQGDFGALREASRETGGLGLTYNCKPRSSLRRSLLSCLEIELALQTNS